MHGGDAGVAATLVMLLADASVDTFVPAATMAASFCNSDLGIVSCWCGCEYGNNSTCICSENGPLGASSYSYTNRLNLSYSR